MAPASLEEEDDEIIGDDEPPFSKRTNIRARASAFLATKPRAVPSDASADLELDR